MATDSTVAGYLAPSPPPPDYDATLEDIFQGLAVGLTQLPGEMVRPRWQVNPANLPSQQDNWMAFGVVLGARQWDAYLLHDPQANAGNGATHVQGSESLEVTFSFYGPNAQLYESMLRDGMSIGQNRDALAAKKIKFKEFRDPVNLPALLKDVWTRRIDLTGIFSRSISRTYAISHFDEASAGLDNERYITPISVPNP